MNISRLFLVKLKTIVHDPLLKRGIALKEDNSQHRKIKSFVKREGRKTAGQERALNELLPAFGVDQIPGILNFDEIFGRSANTILEIGFGMGQSLLEQAETNADTNYLGIEVHSPGVGSLLNGMEEKTLSNIRVSSSDAVEILGNNIADGCLSGVQLFFPDPWHKKKHHKRRIVKAEFVQAIVKKLKPGGFFHLATDWENYAEHMLEIISQAVELENAAGENAYIERPESRPLTKFEKRGHRLGHGVWDLMFIRKQD